MIEPTIQPIGVEMLKENCDVVLGQDGSEAGLIRQINEHQIEALVTRAEQVTRKVIESCPSLKVIAQYGVGLDNINVAAASENGVMVLNVPDGNFISVAEHVMLSVLCLSRMVVNADHAVRAGEWSAYREAHSPQEIYEKTLLIIGFGRIGRDVAAKAQAFGMKVMAFDPFVTSKQMAALGVTKADPLEVGLREADYVTIQLHLTPETRGMMSIQMPFSSRMNFDSPLSSSMVPRAAEFAFKISASSFADIKDSMTGAYLFKISSDAVPSRISLTSLYTPRTLELMIVFLKSYFVM